MSIAIDVNNLSINYKSIEPVSVRKGISEITRRRSNIYGAIRNVSFSVKQGEIVGIIGENGSGKSTLLRTIAGIYSPDTGKINTYGNSVSLLAIGVGFQKELTGRVNILLSGLLLGFSEKEIKKRTPEIIEFSELGKFIDKPVQTYSSGMYSKLAFAITAILETDIMLIDEVFSVGDAKFKKKSFEKMQSLISDERRTVMIVSHSTNTLRQICDRVIWMHEGKILVSGKTDDVLNAYENHVLTTRKTKTKAVILNSGLGKRMGSLTDNCHKSMVKLYNGETIFGRQLRLLRECGIRDIIVTTGPFVDQLKTEASRFPDIKIKFVHNADYEKTNYIHSLYLAKKELDSDILLLHGDLVFNKKLLLKIMNNTTPNLGCVNKKLAQPEKDFKARLVGSNIKEIAVDIFDNNCYAFQPLYKLDRRMVKAWMAKIEAFIKAGNNQVYAENALNQLLDSLKLGAFSYTSDFIEEVDNTDDLKRVSKGIKSFDNDEIPIHKGRGSIVWLKQILASEDVKKPMLVCGPSFEKLNVRQFLESENITPVYFSGFKPNPDYDDIVKGVELFKKENCDFIISVGGGSAIDTAKCIKLFSTLEPTANYLQQSYQWNQIKHLAVPTTAGTGSESTRYSVIYYQGEKQSVMHYSILPDYVILDADLLETVPDYHKKVAFLDALAHCIEALWSVHVTKPARRLATLGISLLLENFDSYFADNEDATEKILEAANLAGQAINITQTAAAHAFSYKLTTLYGIAHGHAVGICIPDIWEFVYNNTDSSPRKKSLDLTWKQLCDAFAADTIENAIAKYRNILSALGIHAPSVNSSEELELLSSSVNPVRLKNSMVTIDSEKIDYLYRKILNFGSKQ